MLFPTLDETVALIARNHERLSQAFTLVTPGLGPGAVGLGQAKHVPTRGRARHSLPPHVASSLVDDLAEVDCSRPVVIKPAIKEHFIYATKAKAWRADTREELERRFADAQRIAGEDEILIQELIPGSGRQLLGYCAFVREGRPVATMVSRRWRQHPPEFGRASTYVETIEDRTVEELSERLLSHLGTRAWSSSSTRSIWTGRTSSSTSTRARGDTTLSEPQPECDFPLVQYLHSIGEDVPQSRARLGVRWVRLLTDTPTAVVEIVQRRLTARQYVRSLLRADTEAVFARDDPLPGLVEVLLTPYLIATRGF